MDQINDHMDHREMKHTFVEIQIPTCDDSVIELEVCLDVLACRDFMALE